LLQKQKDMNTHADKTQETKKQLDSEQNSHKQNGGDATFQFVDNRPEAVAQRKLQEIANNSSQVSQLRALHGMVHNCSSNQQQFIQKKKDNCVSNVVQRVVYNSLVEVANQKFLPSSGNYTDEQKLEIANWCANDNGGSNSIKSTYEKDFAFIYSTVTDNNKDYLFTFMWDLAIHIDLGGTAHGGIDTPHLQAVAGLNGMQGSTKSQVRVDGNAADGSAGTEIELLFNSRDNAVFIEYVDLKRCMDAGNLAPAKEKIQTKIIKFSKDWARAYSDKASGARNERAQELYDDMDFGLFSQRNL
jgi:hypothetical protein